MRPFLKASNNKLINAIKNKYNLTKDQIADLMRLLQSTLTAILNSATSLMQYLPMSEKWSKKYKDSIDCNNQKVFHKRHIVKVKRKKKKQF